MPRRRLIQAKHHASQFVDGEAAQSGDEADHMEQDGADTNDDDDSIVQRDSDSDIYEEGYEPTVSEDEMNMVAAAENLRHIEDLKQKRELASQQAKAFAAQQTAAHVAEQKEARRKRELLKARKLLDAEQKKRKRILHDTDDEDEAEAELDADEQAERDAFTAVAEQVLNSSNDATAYAMIPADFSVTEEVENEVVPVQVSGLAALKQNGFSHNGLKGPLGTKQSLLPGASAPNGRATALPTGKKPVANKGKPASQPAKPLEFESGLFRAGEVVQQWKPTQGAKDSWLITHASSVAAPMAPGTEEKPQTSLDANSPTAVDWDNCELQHMCTLRSQTNPSEYETFVYLEPSTIPIAISQKNGLSMMQRLDQPTRTALLKEAMTCDNVRNDQCLLPMAFYRYRLKQKQTNKLTTTAAVPAAAAGTASTPVGADVDERSAPDVHTIATKVLTWATGIFLRRSPEQVMDTYNQEMTLWENWAQQYNDDPSRMFRAFVQYYQEVMVGVPCTCPHNCPYPEGAVCRCYTKEHPHPENDCRYKTPHPETFRYLFLMLYSHINPEAARATMNRIREGN